MHHKKPQPPLRHILAAIAALTMANSSWAFDVSQDTGLDRDYNEPFVFTASGVILDCFGHTINGNGIGNGVTVTNKQRVRVRNCRITNFNRGVLLDGTTDSVFEANEVDNNKGSGMPGNMGAEGFHLQNESDRNLFAHNSVHDNARDGFDLDFSNGNAFVLNFVENNGINGIELDDCSDNDIIANLIIGNKHTGVSLDRSIRNVINKNTINENQSYGAHFAMGSNNNIFRYNDMCGNTPDQFLIRGTGNQVIQNALQAVCP